MKALIVVIMGGVGNMLGAWSPAWSSASAETLVAAYVDPGLTLAVNFALFLAVLLVQPAGPVRQGDAMTARTAGLGVLGAGSARAARLRAASRQRLLSRARHQPPAITPCWRPPGRCSPGPTRYISLATAAFFGIGAYTVAVLGEMLPWPLVLLIAAALGVVVAR